MHSAITKTAVAATTALIISLAPIATADLAFAHGGGGGGGSRGGGGGHFLVGANSAWATSREATFCRHGAFRERGFHRHFGLFGGPFGDCGGSYSYPYPPYGPYGYNYCD